MCTHYLAGCGWFRKCLGFVYTIYSTIVFRDIVRCCDAVARSRTIVVLFFDTLYEYALYCLFVQAMGTCEDIIAKFGGVGLSLQVHEEMESLKSECQRLAQSEVKYPKLLVLETFLMNAAMKLSRLKPGPDGEFDEAGSVIARNMKSLILEEQTFLFENKLGLSEADVHPGLLAACKKQLG